MHFTFQGQQNEETKLNTRSTKNRKRKSINFIAPKDNRPNVYNQSVTGRTPTRVSKVNTGATSPTISASSIRKLSDSQGGLLDSQSSTSSKDSKSQSSTRTKAGQKRKSTGDNVQQATSGGLVKKRKTSKNRSENQVYKD